MIKSVYGLKNIQKTYSNDKLFGCTIDTIIDNIKAKCMEIKLKKPDLFPNEYEEEPNKKIEMSNQIDVQHEVKIEVNNEDKNENEIKKSKGKLQGEGLAIAGLVIGYLWIFVIFISIVAGVAINDVLNSPDIWST
jgi:hypothetical protein